MVAHTAISEADLVQSICRESFFEFVKEFWEVIIPEEPVWNWHIEFICWELQQIAERVFKGEEKAYDEIFNIPPGTTKSTICSIMFHPWCWCRAPWIRIISTSYEHTKAVEFARKARDIVLSEKYQATFRFKKVGRRYEPSTDADAIPITLKNDQNTKGFYENTFHGDRKSAGTDGNVTGSHSHIILVDDPANPKAVLSDADRKTINDFMSETLPSRKVNKAISVTILIMQRLHQDDPTGSWMAKLKTNVRHVCLPCDDSWPIKPERLKSKYIDGLLDPVRLSRSVLAEARKDLGEYGYAGQYGQQPVPPGGGLFKIDRIKFDIPPARVKFVRLCRYWDKAATKDAGAYSCGVLMGKDSDGKFWILDVIRGQWDSAERERIIKQTAVNDGKLVVTKVEQEPGSGGKESAQSTIRNLAGHNISAERPTGDKSQRADPFSSQVNGENVYVPKNASWWPDYRAEMQFFPFSKYKDQIDASSGAFNELVSRVRVGAV